jgi:hypothetical protein
MAGHKQPPLSVQDLVRPGRAEDGQEPKRRGGGSKLSRSETVTVRLDSKLRYLAELAARKQRRTLSSFIEWSIEETLKQVRFVETTDFGNPSIADEASQLWDVDEPDRFAKLALRHPDMLTHDEQVLWKLVRDNGLFWRGRYVSGKWTWKIGEDDLIFERLRQHWDVFNAVARGDADRASLPNWSREEPKPLKATGGEMDDEIPF